MNELYFYLNKKPKMKSKSNFKFADEFEGFVFSGMRNSALSQSKIDSVLNGIFQYLSNRKSRRGAINIVICQKSLCCNQLYSDLFYHLLLHLVRIYSAKLIKDVARRRWSHKSTSQKRRNICSSIPSLKRSSSIMRGYLTSLTKDSPIPVRNHSMQN